MFPLSTSAVRRPAWMMNLLALALLLASSAGLLWVLADGAPSRVEIAGILAVLLLTPTLIRWRYGWLALFMIIPWVSWLRRVHVVLDPNSPARENFDLILLLPDAIVVATLCGLLLTRHLQKRVSADPAERPLLVAMGLFIGLSLIECFNPAMGAPAAGLNLIRVFLMYMGLYWITRQVAGNMRMTYAWVIITVVSGAICGAYGAYQYLIGFPAYDRGWAETAAADTQVIGEAMRAFSTFSFTSTFSHFMVIAIFVGFGAMRLEGVGRLFRLLVPLMVGMALLGLAVTFVRSAFLGVIVAGLVGLVLAGQPAQRVRRLVSIMAIGTAVIVMMPGSAGDSRTSELGQTGALVAERLLSMRDPTQAGGTFNFRLSVWTKIITNAATLYPVGVGFGAGQAGRFGGNPVAAAYAYSESQFFSMLAEMGWPGFVLFLWITLYGLVYSVRCFDAMEDPERKRLALMGVTVQVALLVTGVTGGTVLYTLPGSAYYWTAMGLVAALARAEREERADREARARSLSGNAA